MKVFKKLGTQLLGFTDGATWKNDQKQNSKDWVGQNPGHHTRARSSRELEPTSGAGGSVPELSHGKRSLAGYSPSGLKKSYKTKHACGSNTWL